MCIVFSSFHALNTIFKYSVHEEVGTAMFQAIDTLPLLKLQSGHGVTYTVYDALQTGMCTKNNTYIYVV